MSIESITDNFCLGNIDHYTRMCRNTVLDFQKVKEINPNMDEIQIHPPEKLVGGLEPLEFACPDQNDYIFELKSFGFLYKIDYEHDFFSDGAQTCEGINEDDDEADKKKTILSEE